MFYDREAVELVAARSQTSREATEPSDEKGSGEGGEK